MKFTVINDTHIFGPLQICTLHELTDIIRASPNTTILNGDIVDLKNCKKSQILEAKAAIEFLRRENCVYLSGNHELEYGLENLSPRAILGTTYFEHSDLLSNYNKYWDFRRKKPGAGWLKRHIVTPLIDVGRHLKEVRPNAELLASVAHIKLMYPHVTMAFFGHAHPGHDISFEHAGIRCVIKPRGVHEVEV